MTKRRRGLGLRIRSRQACVKGMRKRKEVAMQCYLSSVPGALLLDQCYKQPCERVALLMQLYITASSSQACDEGAHDFGPEAGQNTGKLDAAVAKAPEMAATLL